MDTPKDKSTNSYEYETYCKKINCSFDANIKQKNASYLNIAFYSESFRKLFLDPTNMQQ